MFIYLCIFILNRFRNLYNFLFNIYRVYMYSLVYEVFFGIDYILSYKLS